MQRTTEHDLFEGGRLVQAHLTQANGVNTGSLRLNVTLSRQKLYAVGGSLSRTVRGVNRLRAAENRRQAFRRACVHAVIRFREHVGGAREE